ncbi:MAG: hypothetical protein GXZ14_02290 [Ruminococcaceae bacterium]|nr:hypothetical protein [Oscillospiraceae bacterium]
MSFEEIKAKFDDCADKIKNDHQLAEKFKADPVKTIEDTLGVDLPDEQVKAAAEFVKAKIAGIDTSAIVDDAKKTFDGIVADAKAGTLDDKIEGKVSEVVKDVENSDIGKKVINEAERLFDKVKDVFKK